MLAPTSLGSTGLAVSPLCLGLSQAVSLSTRHSFAEARATLEEALERGINFFDTADVYGQGDSERLLGRVARGRRDALVLCTKAGLVVGRAAPLVRLAKPFLHPILLRLPRARAGVSDARRSAQSRCYEPGRLRRCLEGSLRRLGTDCVDLFLLHSPLPEEVGDPQLALLAAVRRDGLARHTGVSVDSAETARAFFGRPGVECIQVPASRADPAAFGLREEAEAKGVGLVFREPFGGGAVLADIVARGEAANREEAAARALREARGLAGDCPILLGATCREHLRGCLAAMGG